MIAGTMDHHYMIKDPNHDSHNIINYHDHDPSLRPDKASRRAGNWPICPFSTNALPHLTQIVFYNHLIIMIIIIIWPKQGLRIKIM